MRMFSYCAALERGMQFCEPTAPSVREDRVGAPHRVLVIEDDTALREMLCEALAGEGYRVLPSDHPVAPLDVQQLRPSLVVLDLMLGGEPGGLRLAGSGPGLALDGAAAGPGLQ